jgi:DNA-binding CsgD family transcriptional regulator
LSSAIAPIILGQLKKPRLPGTSNQSRLTLRELEVLRLLSDGSTSKDIAQRLGISPKTAQAHRENIKNKLGLRSTAEMVRYAIKHRIIKFA